MTDPETLAKAFLKARARESNQSGFVFRDGTWIPLGDHTHEQTINQMYRAAIMPAGTQPGEHALAECFGAVSMTAAMGHLGVFMLDPPTTRQLSTLATRIITSIIPPGSGKVVLDMRHHRSRTYHARLQRLVGDQYQVVHAR